MRDWDSRGHDDQASSTGAVQRQEIGVGKQSLINVTFAPRASSTGGPLQLRTLQPNVVPHDEHIQAAAARGLEEVGGSLPHLDAIQRAFGRHDVTGINAHVGGPAAEATQAMGAEAYATGTTLRSVAHRAFTPWRMRRRTWFSSAAACS